MRIVNTLLALAALSLSLHATAGEKEDVAVITRSLATLIPSVPERISPSPIPGIYEAVFGSNIYYVSADGRYLMEGQLLDLQSRTNLTDQHRATARLKAFASVDSATAITYPAKGEEKYAINVFTDIDCGYCRKLHDGMARMNELGITVHYYAYPRAGKNSPSYFKAVSVWCADDRNSAMDAAKSGALIEKRRCDSPVDLHMSLAEHVGVSGTPAIVFPDGTLLPGYLPPERLLAALAGGDN